MNNNPSSNQIRIAWFTPSPGKTESLSEVFTANTLPQISQKCFVKVYTDSFAPYENYPTGHYLTAAADHRREPYDLFIYQFENHTSSHFSRAHSGLIPGLVIFHHINFVDYGAESFLNSPWTKIITQLNQPQIDWPSRENKYLPLGPFGNREAAFALQGIFINPQNLSEFKRCQHPSSISRQYNLHPQHLSFPVNIPESVSSVKELRLASVAKPSSSERVPQLLKALKNNPEWKLSWLIESAEQEAAQALINEFKVESQVDFTHGRTVANWEQILTTASVAVHLLFSVFEQPCPYLALSMGQGKTIIASDYGYIDYLPEDLIFKIPPGVGEEKIISELLKELAAQPQFLNSTATYEYAKEHFAKEFVTSELEQVIDRNLPTYRRFYADWLNFTNEARGFLIREVAGLSDRQAENLPQEFKWQEHLQEQFRELNWS